MTSTCAVNKPNGRPITFTRENYGKVERGEKTQTRRVVRAALLEKMEGRCLAGEEENWCPHGRVGDLLYVKPTRFTRRVDCTLWLRVKAVRVERVQEIGVADAMEETGCAPNEDAIRYFVDMWDSINAKRPGCSWKDNPWVWVIEFERTEQPQ